MIVISIGVFLTVLGSAWFKGVFSDMIDVNANFSTGHVKVMTRAYAENVEQMPNDLALLEVGQLSEELRAAYPEIDWVQRIHFGGLLDLADDSGETRGQGMAVGQGVDFLSPGTREPERMNIPTSIVQGALPSQSGEALISEDFARRFNVKVGEEITFFGSTMNGGIALSNFTVAGTVRFGMAAMDRGAILIDIADAQKALDMDDAAGEILGFFKDGPYDAEKAISVKNDFNRRYEADPDEFAPLMLRLHDQNQLEGYLGIADYMSAVMIFIFVAALSIVLWNTGLLGGLRRYSEFGIRLAMGEEKKHIFRTLLIEAIAIGIIGSVIGTALGLSAAYYMQEHGISMGTAIQGGAMMMPGVFKAHVTTESFYIGFIPGLFSMVLGNALSGIGIYKRKTAELFKELSV